MVSRKVQDKIEVTVMIRRMTCTIAAIHAILRAKGIVGDFEFREAFEASAKLFDEAGDQAVKDMLTELPHLKDDAELQGCLAEAMAEYKSRVSG